MNKGQYSIPENEQTRLKLLDYYSLWDEEFEEDTRHFAELAAFICNTPTAFISLLDEHNQWIKARVGWSNSKTDRSVSFCQYAIMGSEILEIEDANEDPRFDSNPLVRKSPGIRFYAGAPLADSKGNAIGTLCVIDYEPGKLNENQRKSLKKLADQLLKFIFERTQRKRLQWINDLSNKINDHVCFLNQKDEVIESNKAFNVHRDHLYDKSSYLYFPDVIYPDDRHLAIEQLQKLKSGKALVEFTSRVKSKSSSVKYITWTITRDVDNLTTFVIGRDVTKEKNREKLLEITHYMAQVGGGEIDFINLSFALI